MMSQDPRKSRPVIGLLGPPGVRKTVLGRRACSELGLTFVDWAGAEPGAPAPANDNHADVTRLERALLDGPGEVIELPWNMQQDPEVLKLLRRIGVPVVLWAHPLDMQARSGRHEPLFTPVPRLKVRGGFGRRGTGCREFRRLDRACEEVIELVDLTLDEAAQVVTEAIADIRAEYGKSALQREGIASWIRHWERDHAADPAVSRVIVEAMADYLVHLRAAGKSAR